MHQEQKISLLEKISYGSGQIGLNALYTLFSAYVMMFYTDIIGIAPAIVGVIILISKFFDGFSDLVAGQLIDTHKGKHGHCIPILAKWTIPMAISVLIIFLVPSSNLVLQIIFIFVTYNLFNTFLYTYICMAYASLPTYVTNNSVERSKMLVISMLFAAATQSVVAGYILPVIDFFGGMNDRMAWIKATIVFGIIGCFFVFLSVIFVKERVENDSPPENMLHGLKVAFKNKYWILTVILNICNNIILIFNLQVSVYYLKDVIGNSGLMAAFISVSNLPGVILMLIVPAFLGKISKQKIVLLGTCLMVIAQILFIVGPSDNTMWFLATGLLRGIGFGLPMGLAGAMIGDCVDYGEWKTGVRVQSVLFSANTVGQKIGQGILTSIFGFYLQVIGYNGLKATQTATAVEGINIFFKYVPLIFSIIMVVTVYFFDLEKKLPQIQKELSEKSK